MRDCARGEGEGRFEGESEEVVLARTRGAPDEHRLSGGKVLGFRHTVRPFLPRKHGGSWSVVGRERGLGTKSGGQIRLEHPAGCCLERIDASGGQSGAANLRRVVLWTVDVEPLCGIFRIVKVEENVFILDAI